MTISLEQLKFGMFLFGVGVGFDETREVTRGDGTRKGWVQFVEGDDSSINIHDKKLCYSNVDNPAMLDLVQEVHHFEFLIKNQSLRSQLAQINQVMSEPTCNWLVDIFVTVHEPVHSVAPVLLWLIIGEDLSKAFMHKQRLCQGMKLVATEVKNSVLILLVKINGE